jgi:hypothetical protein
MAALARTLLPMSNEHFVQGLSLQGCSNEHLPQIIRFAMVPEAAAGQPESRWQMGQGKALPQQEKRSQRCEREKWRQAPFCGSAEPRRT